MKKIPIILTAMAGALFCLSASAEILITNEFWICNSTNTANLGTLDNPFDGSTQAKFDTLMNAMPEKATIHILAGTYETWGSYDWNMKSGQKIIGSGRDVTIIQLPTGTPQFNAGTSAIYSQFNLTNAEVADLTCDCNWQGGTYTYAGVVIGGTGNIVRRVRVIHAGYYSGTNSEAWGIALSAGSLSSSQGNIIEDCEVSQFAGGHNITAIGMAGEATSSMSGIIRNNVVLLSPDPVGSQLAINCAWVTDVIIEGNYVNGADVGVYGDTGGCTNMLVTHNVLINCFEGARYANANRYNLTFDFNNISLVPASFTSAAFDFFPGSVTGTLTNVIIFGNTISFYGSPSSSIVAVIATNLTGLVFANNSVDATIANNQATTPYFNPVANLSMYNNTDLFGNYLSSLNIPTVGGVEVSPLGLNLISSAEASSALTNLGLPSNPAAVITNNETGVTLSGTFSGNGNGLTNLNATIGASFILNLTTNGVLTPNLSFNCTHANNIASNTFSFNSGSLVFWITNWFQTPFTDNLYAVQFVYNAGIPLTVATNTPSYTVFTGKVTSSPTTNNYYGRPIPPFNGTYYVSTFR